MSLIKGFSKDTLIYGVGTVIQKIIGIILLPFYTRALLPAEYGILDTLTTMTMLLLTIFGFGISGSLSRYFFIADSDDEKKKLIYTAIAIKFFSSSIPAIILILFSSRISELLFNTDEYSLVIVATAFLLLFNPLQDIQLQLFRFYREPVKFSIVTIVKSIVYPFSGILLVVIFKFGVMGATLSYLITSVIGLVFGYFYFTKNKYIPKFSWAWAKTMIKFGFPLIFYSLLSWVNLFSDRFFLLHFQNLDQIGLYSISNTFSQPIVLLNEAIAMSYSVFVFSIYQEEKENNKPKTKTFLTKIWYTYLTVAILLACIVSIFSFDLIRLIATSKYIQGILAIPFLLFSHILNMGTQLTGNGMTIKEQSKPYAIIMFFAAVTNFGLNFYFIPDFGFVGAAITTIVSSFLNFIISYFWSQRVFYIKRSLLRPLLFFLLGLAIAVFFPFYELQIGTSISYLIKLTVSFVILMIPISLKIIDVKSINYLFDYVRSKI